MISNELKTSITSTLKTYLEREEWQYIDSMFDEVYSVKQGGTELVVLKPHPNAGDIAMQFYALTGAFYEIDSWDYIKQVGERIQ